MNIADASGRLLSLLWQASWQGALFAGVVGLFCLLFRLSASQRAFLWLIAGIKFLAGFLWLLFFGRGVPLDVPLTLYPAPSGSGVQGDGLTGVMPWILAAWVAGIIACSVWVVSRARATYQTLSRSNIEASPALTVLIGVLSGRMGVSRRRIPTLCIAPRELAGPQVTLAGSRCFVVLPEALLPPSPAALNEDELRFVLAHELAHVRRGDLWIGLFFAATQILFFFHPFATWVRKEWEAAREEACDLMALRVCSDGATDTTARYGALLLRLGSGATGGSAASARIAASPFAALRRRLTHLSRHQTGSPRGASALATAVALPVLVALMLPVDARFQTPYAETSRGGTPFLVPPALESDRQVPVARQVSVQTSAPSLATSRRIFPAPLARRKNDLGVTKPISFPARASSAIRAAVLPRAHTTPPTESVVPPSITPVLLEPTLAREPSPDTSAVASVSSFPLPAVPDALPAVTESAALAPVASDVSAPQAVGSFARHVEPPITRPAITLSDSGEAARTTSLVAPGGHSRAPVPVHDEPSIELPGENPGNPRVPKP